MSHFQSYTVGKNENLYSISCRIHINDPQDLKQFHNLHCDLNKIIEDDVVEDQVLLIPYSNHELRKIENYRGDFNTIFKNQINKENSFNKFVYNPLEKLTEYKVNIQFIDVFAETEQDFECEFSLKRISEIKNKFIIEVNQKNIQVNNENLNTKISILAKKCADCLYPMKIIVNQNGGFESIHNFEVIKKRWDNTKIELTEDFTGHDFDAYIKKMDYKMNDSQMINESLKNNLLFQTLFYPIYNLEFIENINKKQIAFLEVVNGSPSIEFEIENTINKKLVGEGQIKINQKGQAIDKRSLEDVLSKSNDLVVSENEKKSIKVNYFGEFNLDKQTKLISLYKGEFILFFADNKEITKITIEKM